MSPTTTYAITPIGKPRMTRRDKWRHRAAVVRYFAYRDQVRLAGITLPESGYHVTFILPMPASWPEWRKVEMDGQPHQQRPDLDNMMKGLLDAVFADDARLWDARVTKRWGYAGAIMVGAR